MFLRPCGKGGLALHAIQPRLRGMLLLTGGLDQPLRNSAAVLGPLVIFGVRAVVFFVPQQGSGSLWIIKQLFACWTCVGKDQKPLC